MVHQSDNILFCEKMASLFPVDIETIFRTFSPSSNCLTVGRRLLFPRSLSTLLKRNKGVPAQPLLLDTYGAEAT